MNNFIYVPVEIATPPDLSQYVNDKLILLDDYYDVLKTVPVGMLTDWDAIKGNASYWLQKVPRERVWLFSVQKPKIVCYCGSLRVALDAFKKAEYNAVLKGEIALLPCCMFVDIEREYGAESAYKQMADELHKRKIDIADEVFILNVGGYIGESTRSELEYAKSIGKPIIYLENPNNE